MAKQLFKIVSNASVNLDNIEKGTERAEKRYLFRAGGFALRTAKRLLRPAASKYAKPGEPPKSKTGAMRNGMAFSVSMEERSVIIGPRRDTSKINSLVLHEFGGTRFGKAGWFLVPNKEIRQSDIVEGYEPRPSKKRAHSFVFFPEVTRKYEPRPYMGPALKITTEQPPRRFWIGVK